MPYMLVHLYVMFYTVYGLVGYGGMANLADVERKKVISQSSQSLVYSFLM